MTHDNHDEHDYDLDIGSLDQLSSQELWAAREGATFARDLFCARLADNALEARDVRHVRSTCGTCEDWADHVHDALTGERMFVEWSGWRLDAAGIVAVARTAARVFALAAIAPPADWADCAYGLARAVVELDSILYEVVVPAGPTVDMRLWPAFITSCTISPATGGLRLPVVYATPRASAAIADAYRYLRHAREDATELGRTGAP